MDEYISREAAEKTIAEVINRAGTEAEILTEIHYLPAADVVEVRHGRWKKVISIIPMYECDHCHAITLGGNFCPNCGAKMDGGQNDG